MSLQFVSSQTEVSRETGGELGGALIGAIPVGAMPPYPVQQVNAPLLGAATPVVLERWLSDKPLESGLSEGIAWRRSGDLLFGVLRLDEADFVATPTQTALQAASDAAYRRIFRLLDTQRLPNLWRVWNYLADINRETAGLERYRQFNIGRQDAFLACHRGATGNVPAACALGVASGPLSISFLAGVTPAVPVENPRQVSAYNYPAEYGPRSPTFSRPALVYPAGQEVLFVSGTASIVGHQTVHSGDVAGQARETLTNIVAVLDEANRQVKGRSFDLNELTYRVYVRRASDFAAVRNEITSRISSPAILYIQADVCRDDLLVEIEAFASHPLEN